MLHIYLIKVPAHASAKKMKEENWAMDGFVSIVLWKSAAVFNNKFVLQFVLKSPERDNFLNLVSFEHTYTYKMTKLK